MKKESILIVDDNAKNIQVLATVLTSKNFEIEYCLDGKSAIDWVEKKSFDLILLDIMMPVMDGYSACEKIKELPNGKNTPVIFITAKTDIESLTKAFDVGGIDYITKPFNEKELLARVKTHLDLKRHKDKLEELVELRTQQLQKAYKELEALDEAKVEFLNILSHEIKTPLNGILGPLQLLKSRINDENIIKLLLILEVASKRLEKFANDALLIASLRTKKYRTKITEVDVFKLLEFHLLDYSEIISDKNLTINLNNLQQDLTIKTDNNLLKESLTRVVENAIEFSENNSEIIITNDIFEDNFILTISDEGKGFKESQLNKKLTLFEPGERHIDQNLGIDLYLVNLTMQTLNGKMEFGNNKDKGAYVKLYHPVN
jgi:two-component system sensor histidine kinase/response regulator